jgi:hypothetical protein
MNDSLKSNYLVKIFKFLIFYMREPFMPKLVPRSAFTLKINFIKLSQGIGRVINLNLAILKYKCIKVLMNVNGENNTL